MRPTILQPPDPRVRSAPDAARDELGFPIPIGACPPRHEVALTRVRPTAPERLRWWLEHLRHRFAGQARYGRYPDSDRFW